MSHKLMYFIIVIGIAGLIVLSPGCSSKGNDHDQSNQTEINVGVKTDKVDNARQEYASFIKLLADEVKKPVVLKPCKSLTDLELALSEKKVDFLILSPTDYITLNQKCRINAIASKLNKGGTPYCQGIIVSTKDSQINKVSDLKNKAFHFGPKGSFNKYYAVLSLFKNEGLDYEKDLQDISYGSGCSGIARYILEGKADAGVVCDYSWNEWLEKQSKDPDPDKLLIIGKAPKLRENAIAAAEHVDTAACQEFLDALLSLKANPVLQQPPIKALGFVQSTDQDYNSLRKILNDLKQEKI